MSNKTSGVWNFFTQQSNVICVCNLCGKNYKTGGGTTNLKNHLVHKHPYCEIKSRSDSLSTEANRPIISSFDIAASDYVENFIEDETESQQNIETEVECNVEEINYIINDTSSQNVLPELLSRNKSKKRKVRLETGYAVMKKTEDDIDVFGKFVSSELRGLTKDDLRKKAKHQIQRILLNIAEEEDEDRSLKHYTPITEYTVLTPKSVPTSEIMTLKIESVTPKTS